MDGGPAEPLAVEAAVLLVADDNCLVDADVHEVVGAAPWASLQVVGGAVGNMICVNNVVAVCATVGCPDAEGIIIRRNAIPCFIYAIIVAAVMAYLISNGFNPLPLKV